MNPPSERSFPPFEIAVTRPLPVLTVAEREQVLREAGFNSYAIPQNKILIDLKTDGGTSALSSTQLGAMLEARSLEASTFDLAPQSSIGMPRLMQLVGEWFGFPHVVPCNMGRSAERLLYGRYDARLKDAVVPGNMLFTSTKFQVETRGGKIEDVTCSAADDLASPTPFKGNLDIEKLRATIERVGAERVPFVGIELCVNGFAGHPVSLENVRQVKETIAPHGIPLIIDACRLLANARLIQMHEKGYADVGIGEIVKKLLSYADACTWSASKEFGVRTLGAILLRDKKTADDLTFQSMIEGAQAGTSAIDALTYTMEEAFASDAFAAARVAETTRFWELLRSKGVPVVSPAGGFAVYIDLRAYFPEFTPEDNAPFALAAHVYRESGIRIAKGYFPSERQIANKMELMRLCVPTRRYTTEHYAYVAEVLGDAFAKRAQIRPLKAVADPARGKFDLTRYIPG